MGRVDTNAIRCDHPVASVIARYGIELQHQGQALVGRCPFHADGGRPNLYVYPATETWRCYRCDIGGDVISFVQRIEALGFREAVAQLVDKIPSPSRVHCRPTLPKKSCQARAVLRGPAERACLAAAVQLYHNRLLSDRDALRYVEGRGLNGALLERYRLGFARGDELAAYLRRRRLPGGAARRIGLIDRTGRETMARRVVVPEIRCGEPIWLIGRTIDPTDEAPRYLSLPGAKPLLGWEDAARERVVCMVEGPIDWLTLRRWNYPALALVGTHLCPAAAQALSRFERIYLMLDGDEPGRAATSRLTQVLGERAIPVVLPGVKDVAELALRADGPAIVSGALQRSHRLQAA